jgi:hypothetical protein
LLAESPSFQGPLPRAVANVPLPWRGLFCGTGPGWWIFTAWDSGMVIFLISIISHSDF